MTKLFMMLKSGFVPPPEKMDLKTAQFFVCAAYLRYRKARQRHNQILENFPENVWEEFSAMNESWNALQVFKKFYYEITEPNETRPRTEPKSK